MDNGRVLKKDWMANAWITEIEPKAFVRAKCRSVESRREVVGGCCI